MDLKNFVVDIAKTRSDIVASVSGEEAAPDNAPAEGLRFWGRSCKVVVGMHYHFSQGSWTSNGTGQWDPNFIIAEIRTTSESTRSDRLGRLRYGNFAAAPPLNADLDAVTFINLPYIADPEVMLKFTLNVTSYALPPIFGGEPLIMYVAGNVLVRVDGETVFDKKYISSGGESHFEDNMVLLRRD